MFLAGAIAAGLLFFFTGGGSSSYERAERDSLDTIFSGVESLFSSSASESGSITITPSRELSALIPGLDLSSFGSLKLDYEMILNGTDMYMLLGADVLGINASLALWQLGEEIIMQLPGISDYYILLGNMIAIDTSSPFSLDIDYGRLLDDVKYIAEQLLDKYYELTANIDSKWSEDVTVGNLSRKTDVYEIIVDGEFILELLNTGFEAFLDSRYIMELARSLYDLENDYYKDRSWYQTFDEVIAEMRSELRSLRPRDIDVEITMRVFISGKDIVRRDIIIEDVTLSFASIEDRNGDYAKSFRFSYTDWWDDTTTITLRDEGNKNKDGYSTGQIRLSLATDDPWYYGPTSVTLRYEDVKFYDNGLFGGDIRISVPIEEGLTVDVSFKSTVTGDSMRATGSLTVFGMRVVDVEIIHNTNTGKRISRPELTNNNTLDINNWQDSLIFNDELMKWAEGLGSLELLEDLFWNLGLYNVFGGSSAIWDDWCYYPDDCWCDWCRDWNQPADEDNYCYSCWTYHEWWEACYDWCTGDEWCWCDICYEARLCSSCGNHHWGIDAEYEFYLLSSTKALWRILFSGDWSETLWSSIISNLGDCAAYVWYWGDVFASYGYDLHDIYYEATAIIYTADWEAAYGGWEIWDDSYYWNDTQWERFYRQLLRDGGFAF
jgi:hypothetical protein